MFATPSLHTRAMGEAMPQLTLYRIHEPPDEIEGDAFTRAIDPDVLLDLKQYHAVRPHFEARLFLAQPKPREPEWIDFLRPAYAGVGVPESAANAAVLLVKLLEPRRALFAITFGTGRFLLRHGIYTRDFGLHVALNALLRDRPADGAVRMRAVDLETVAAQTLHTRHQANREATFDAFGMDPQHDLLRAVTGAPVGNGLGSRVTGADAVTVNKKLTFDDLGDLCHDLLRLERRKDYRRDFDWIDNVHTVTDPDLRTKLENVVAARLQAGDVRGLVLAPPEIVDWDVIAAFRFSFAAGHAPASELDLAVYLDACSASRRHEPLTAERLKHHRVEVLDAGGQVTQRWPVFRCLDGEIEFHGRHYLLAAGDFFEIAAGYRRQLDRDLQALAESDVALPKSKHVDGHLESEDAYNRRAAVALEALLLDKQTVKLNAHVTPIEVCDIFTSDRRFIHVKRHLASATLSHLFAQGAVSADLFLMSQEYRKALRAKIKTLDGCSDARRKAFTKLIDVDRPFPGQFEVVYAIVAEWGRRSLTDALPFFSKVNLRRRAQELGRMGYKVRYARVDVA